MGATPTPWQTNGRARMIPINHPSKQPKNHIRPLVGDVLWGVFNTPLPIRMKTIDRQGRGVLHTPHKRARQGPDGPNQSPNDTTQKPHSSPCRGRPMGRMLLRPYPDGQKTRTGGVGRCPFFIHQTIRRPLCVRRNGIGPQAPGKTSCKDAPGNPSVRSGA